MRPKLNIKPYNIFEAYQQRLKQPINPGYMVGQHPVARQNFDTWFKTVPSDRRDISSYNLRRAYELAPMEELEAWRKSSVADLEAGKNHLRSVYENPETGEYEFMKSRNHPTLQYELDWYNGDSKDAKEFRDKYALDTSGEYYKYIPRRQKDSSESSVATALDPSSYTFTGEQLGIEEPVKQQQPVAAPRQTEPKVSGALNGFFSGLTGRRREWPGSANAGRSGAIGYLGSVYTSPEEEERYLRQSQNKTKLMAVADALRQFGNIYYTSRYATPQKFNDIYAQERARYLQDKAVRDRDNQYYFQQKAREAQMDMQRERMEAEAARRAEELAMKKEINELRKPYYENQAKEAQYRAEMKEKEAKNYDTVLKNKNDLDEAKVGATKATENARLASAERARVAAMNDTRRTNSTIAKNARTGGGGGGSRGGGSKGGSGYTYATDQGYIERAKDFNKIELNQWENWLRETKQFTPEFEKKLKGLSGKDRENMVRYAIGYSLEHNPKATAYATQHHKATSTQTKPRNTRGKAAAKPQRTGNGGSGGGGNSGNGGGTWKNFSIHKSK